MRLARLVTLVVLVLLAVACGKRDLHDRIDPRWSDPTAENGFRPVVPRPCDKVDAKGIIRDSSAGTLEDVQANMVADVLASDDRYIYWGTDNVIRRAERATAPWPQAWKVSELLALDRGGTLTDLAVTRGRIYWVVRQGEDRIIRFVEKRALGVTTTLETVNKHALSRLVARGASLSFAHGASSFEVSDAGEQRVRSFGMEVPVDMASDGGFLYWLERGTSAADDCAACTTGYEMKGVSTTYPNGKLRRAPVGGGPATDLFTGIPEVQALTLVRGIVWISTEKGLLRYDPSDQSPPKRLVAAAGLQGRAVPFGEALAVAGSVPAPRIVLLGYP